MALSPCIHRIHAPSRQIRPALMLARRPQRASRPSPPLRTPKLGALGHTPSPSLSSATTQRTMNTNGAPKRNLSAPNSPATTRNAEPLGWQFHFIARLPRDRTRIRQAGARHDYQITIPSRRSDHAKWVVGAAITSIARQPKYRRCHRVELPRTSKHFASLVATSYWSKPVLPRFVDKTFLCLLVYLWPSDLDIELREMPAAATTDVERPVVATKATQVRTSSPQSSKISAKSSQAKVAATAAATAAETTGALLVAVPGRSRCGLKARVT